MTEETILDTPDDPGEDDSTNDAVPDDEPTEVVLEPGETVTITAPDA